MSELSQFVRDLESSVNLISYLEYLGLSFNKNSMGLCINHNEKKASMMKKDDHLYCFTCGFYGRAVNITMIVKGVGFKEALDILCDYMKVPRFNFGKKSQKEIQIYQEQKKREDQIHKTLQEAVEIYKTSKDTYLQSRGISKEIIEKFQIGSTNEDKFFLKKKLMERGFLKKEFASILLNSHGQDFFRNCTIIPIFKSGKCVGLYGRKNDGSKDYKHLYIKGDGFKNLGIEPETTLFNWDNARKSKEVYIFESIIDCLTALSNDIPNSAAIFGTQGLKKEHIKQLKQARTEEVYLVMDGDEPGKKAAIKHGHRLEEAGFIVNIILLPKNQDANEYFEKNGSLDTFRNLPQSTPLQLEIARMNSNLKGSRFLKSIEPVLKRIALKDPLIWKDELEEIKGHFKNKPSISKLEAKIKQIIGKDKNLPEVVSSLTSPITSNLEEIFYDPALNNLVIPENWQISKDKIVGITLKGDEIFEIPLSYSPCIIKSMASNIDTGNEFRELLFKQNGKVKNINVPRETICDQKKIIELSAFDFPVTSNNNKAFIQFFFDFEAANRKILPKQSITHGFGDRKDSKKSPIFYLPQKTYGTEEKIIFQGKGVGDKRFYNSLKAEGSYQEWKRIIQSCLEFPVVMFAIYAGFATCIMKRLGLNSSFIIDLWGDTSIGKTALIELVASIWGDPRRLVIPWDSTKVAAEQLVGMFNGIPTFLDESQLGDPKIVADIIYRTANSTGRARGAMAGGLQEVLTWLTILFSTGEKKLSSVTKLKGAMARILSFWGSPFLSSTKETGRLVKQIKRTIYENYGHGIIPFQDYMYTQKDSELKSYYQDCTKHFDALITHGGVDSRKSDNFALVLTSGFFFEEVFNMGSKPLDICLEVFNKEQEEKPLDLATESKEHMVSVINANRNYFQVVGNEEISIERGEIWGVINPGEYVAIFSHKLKKILSDEDYSPSTILKLWKEKGWIQAEKERMTVKVGFKGEKSRMVKMSWKFYGD